MSSAADYVIIGGGIAGASLGYWLAPHGRVVVLERESQPGYHATGRSAALFMESYGTPQVRALTRASRAFLEAPPPGFAEHPLLSPRGALMVAMPGEEALLDAHWRVLGSVTDRGRRLDRDAALRMMPALRPEQLSGAVYEPDAADMDVNAIHQCYLRGMRRAGGRLVCSAEIVSLMHSDGLWQVGAGGQVYEAPVVCNAAGAWVDEVAAIGGVRPIGIQPRRRSAFVFGLPPDRDAADWPMTIGVAEDWYIKPDAGMMLGSPANADLVTPQDVQPEELDIAGFDADVPGFFWVAAQGGYGIQTSPAMGEACAALARGLPLPARISGFGLDEAMLGPRRLRLVSRLPAAAPRTRSPGDLAHAAPAPRGPRRTPRRLP